MRVAALFVRADSCYADLGGVELWLSVAEKRAAFRQWAETSGKGAAATPTK